MRFGVMVLFIVGLISCAAAPLTYEKEFYERVTGIKVPDSFKVMETFDNGEFLTGTTFRTDSLSLLVFVKKYKFTVAGTRRFPVLWGEVYMKGIKPDKNKIKDVYFISESKGEENWTYIADTKKGVLWADIMYPDGGGK